ncbi:carbon-nitrogen hydrolase family protein [Pseudomonas sp. nanlin1]|uniref:carbon-nitrogen hydrolase family protein n=1 Tax=Pseudomonas sp. nanlin1 TaxID=3040605 RepID=UPI0038900AEE
MRIALYQCPSQPSDTAGNLQRLQVRAAEAARWHAELLVCPEMFLSGYNIGIGLVSRLAEAADGAFAEQVARIAQDTGVAILYGYPERAADGQLYNAVQLIDATGRRLCNYRKTHLFGELDRSMFSASDQPCPVFEFNGWRVGLLICYDLEFAENARQLALAGAELILVPTANMLPYEFVADVTVRSRAFENQCYVVYANYCGQEVDVHYCGLSNVVGPDGVRIAEAGQEEALIVGTLDREAVQRARGAFSYLADRRPALYSV